MTMLRTEDTDHWVYLYIPEGWPLNGHHEGVSFYATFDDAKQVQKFYGGPTFGRVHAQKVRTAELVEETKAAKR